MALHCTTLHQAARSGNVAELRRLAGTGANVDDRDAKGETALHWAVVYGHVEAIRVLVELGADKSAKAVGGATALHLATQGGFVEAMEMLTEPVVPIYRRGWIVICAFVAFSYWVAVAVYWAAVLCYWAAAMRRHRRRWV